MTEERYAVSFSVSLMWEDKSGLVRRLNGRCVDLSPEGMKIETRDRLEAGTVVTVQSEEFGRMGHAIVRHLQREKMFCRIGLKFSAAFGLGDPARRRILERVLSPDTDSGDGPGAGGRGARLLPARTPGGSPAAGPKP